jgi:serine/threonine-protein kinase
MAYAHSKGILHRDLKPDNVMLGEFGETLVVDWGLAKEMGRAESEETDREIFPAAMVSSNLHVEEYTPLTEEGQILGTPAFMSPEQARSELDKLGPATDIYSLGAILYVLLTGQSPHRGSLMDVILDLQVGKAPSPPRTVQPRISRALEAICLKAMATKPEERYPTAAALAQDIERWLADEPIAVFAEPWSTKTRRWLRKHRTLAATSMAGLIFLSGFLLTLTALTSRQNRDLAQAFLHERIAREQALSAQQQAVTARDRARNILEDMASEEQIELLRRQRALTPEQKRHLQQLVRYYQEFATEEVTSAEHRQRQARAYQRLGHLLQTLGRMQEAEVAYRHAVTSWRFLSDHAPAPGDFRQEQVSSQEDLANVLRDLGRQEEAEQELRAALAVQQRLLAEQPQRPGGLRTLASIHNHLAIVLENCGRWEAAALEARRTLALVEKLQQQEPKADVRWLRAAASLNLSNALKKLGQWEEAEKVLLTTVQLRREMVAQSPDDPENRFELGKAVYNLSLVLRSRGKPSESLTYQRQTLDVFQTLCAGYPSDPEYAWAYCLVANGLAVTASDQGEHDQALKYLDRGLKRLTTLLQHNPNIPMYHRMHGDMLTNKARALQAKGQLGEAALLFSQAVRCQAYALKLDPKGNATHVRSSMEEWQRRLALPPTSSP